VILKMPLHASPRTGATPKLHTTRGATSPATSSTGSAERGPSCTKSPYERRSLLCLKRNIDEQGVWAFGKEFIAILRERRLPKMEGREGAMFCIFWGQVSADSDGPVEFCKPVPAAEAHALAGHYPELTLRTEPAHREAFVALGPYAGENTVQWELASEALRTWAAENAIDPENLQLRPEDLGARITYLAVGPVTETSAPDCDFAVPFA